MFYLNDNSFGDFFDEMNRAFGGNDYKMMQTDIKEDKDSYELLMDLPGVDKKDVKMDYNDGYLTISVSHEENKNDKNDKKDHKYVRQERRYVSGERSFYLGDINESEIKAKFADGVLTVTLPKQVAVEAPKKYIAIE